MSTISLSFASIEYDNILANLKRPFLLILNLLAVMILFKSFWSMDSIEVGASIKCVCGLNIESKSLPFQSEYFTTDTSWHFVIHFLFCQVFFFFSISNFVQMIFSFHFLSSELMRVCVFDKSFDLPKKCQVRILFNKITFSNAQILIHFPFFFKLKKFQSNFTLKHYHSVCFRKSNRCSSIVDIYHWVAKIYLKLDTNDDDDDDDEHC